jgi:hypothetical protein
MFTGTSTKTYFSIQSCFISINIGLIAEEVDGNKLSLVISYKALSLKGRRLHCHVARLLICNSLVPLSHGIVGKI